jgi:hypothetical protein
MARPKNTTASRTVELSMPADAHACLEKLADMGRYGGTAASVARYLLTRAIDDLTRDGVLPAKPLDGG